MYGHLKSTKPVTCKSKVVKQNVGVVYLWVWQEVGVVYLWVWCICGCGKVQNVCFFLSLIYTTTFPDITFWKAYDLWLVSYSPRYTFTVHCKLWAIRHFVCVSNISYGLLNSTRPVAGQLKVVRPRSRCGICVGVWRNKMCVSRSGCGKW